MTHSSPSCTIETNLERSFHHFWVLRIPVCCFCVAPLMIIERFLSLPFSGLGDTVWFLAWVVASSRWKGLEMKEGFPPAARMSLISLVRNTRPIFLPLNKKIEEIQRIILFLGLRLSLKVALLYQRNLSS